MPLSLNFIERLGLVHLNKGPGPIVDIVGALGFKAILVALELNIFELLHKAPLTADELAKKIDAKIEGITLLLDTLINLGYIKAVGTKFEITPMTTTWMLNDSPESMVGLFHHFEDAWERWNYLGESICTGEQAPGLDKWIDKRENGWLRYHSGMRSIANIIGDTIVSRVKLPQRARKLLDVGGSHGLHSIKFCRKYPDLSATIFDLPASRQTAEETIEQEGMEDRVVFCEGDFVTDSIEGTFDVLLLFNFIRIFNPEELFGLLKKSAGLLNSNGMIIILDQFGQPNKSRFTKTNHSLILLELYNQMHKRAYTSDEAMNYLARSGFSSPEILNLPRVGGLAVVTAFKSR
jgi:ubiquinone/menaquinone biosynthesis C-methylase UbiE